MSRGLIDYLTFAYSFLAKGRGILKRDDIDAIRVGAKTITCRAPQVLKDETAPTQPGSLLDFEEAVLINQHIEECAEWLLRQEIV